MRGWRLRERARPCQRRERASRSGRGRVPRRSGRVASPNVRGTLQRTGRAGDPPGRAVLVPPMCVARSNGPNRPSDRCGPGSSSSPLADRRMADRPWPHRQALIRAQHARTALRPARTATNPHEPRSAPHEPRPRLAPHGPRPRPAPPPGVADSTHGTLGPTARPAVRRCGCAWMWPDRPLGVAPVGPTGTPC